MRKILLSLTIFLNTQIVSTQTVATKDLDLASVKAVRPDSPVLGNSNFPASCGDCCEDEGAEDCRLVDIESLLEDLASDISVLSAFDQTCCAQTNSNISVLSAFDQTCCANTTSRLSALSAFDQTCCAQTNSNISVLSAFDQTCCANTTSRLSALSAFDQTCCAQTNSNISVLSAFDQTCCATTNSNISVLAAFDQTALGEIASSISELSAFDQTCCAQTTNSLSVISSQIDALSNCSCCQFEITNADVAGGGVIVITNPGIYCLVEDVTFSTGFAINVSKTVLGDVIIDLSGHSIIGNGSGSGSGIQITGTSNGVVTVRNGTIIIPDIGVEANSSADVVIENVNVIRPAEYGFLIKSCSSVTIRDIAVESAALHGIFIIRTAGILVEDAVISFCINDSVNIDGTGEAIFRNIQSINALGNGFYMMSSAATIFDIVLENCISQRCGVGFFVEQINPGEVIRGVKFINCVAESSISTGFRTRGVDFPNFYGILFKDCEALRTDGTGYEMFGGTSHIFFDSNGSFNRSNGIYIDGCDRCQFVNSVFNNNERHGMELNSSETVVQNCLFNNNTGDGISVDSNSIVNNQFLNSITSGNLGSGISISSNRTVVEKCTADGNAADGIVIQPGVKECTLVNSYASNNGLVGINDNNGGASVNYVWGNSSYNNAGGNYGTGASTPLNAAASLTAPYWANVRP